MNYVLLFTIAIIAGSVPTFLKMGLQTLQPNTLLFLRFFIAAIVFAIIFFKKYSHKRTFAIFKIVLNGFLLSVAIYFITLSINYTSLANVQLILTASPLFVLLGAVLFLKEKVNKTQIIGFLISFIGLYIIIFSKSPEITNSSSLKGNIITLTGAFIGAVYVLGIKKLTKEFNCYSITLGTFIGCSLFFGILSFTDVITLIYSTNVVNVTTIFVVLYLALIGTVVHFWLFNYLLHRTSATFTTVITFITVPVAALYGYLIFNESLNSVFYLGSVFTIFGALLSSKLIAKSTKE